MAPQGLSGPVVASHGIAGSGSLVRFNRDLPALWKPAMLDTWLPNLAPRIMSYHEEVSHSSG